jgi:Mg2+ and Co2+ transporter CorA
MYFDMFLLLLYVRVTLFRFSTQLTVISKGARGQQGDNIEKWSEEFEKLRWQFALFTNLYQFPLISNQQQGLELYALARKCLDVDDLYKEVQSEVRSSHEFILQKQQQRQSETTTRLTMVATIGLALSIVLAFLSTDFGKREADSFAQLAYHSEFLNWRGVGWLALGGLSLFYLVSQSMYLTRRPTRWVQSNVSPRKLTLLHWAAIVFCVLVLVRVVRFFW